MHFKNTKLSLNLIVQYCFRFFKLHNNDHKLILNNTATDFTN